MGAGAGAGLELPQKRMPTRYSSYAGSVWLVCWVVSCRSTHAPKTHWETGCWTTTYAWVLKSQASRTQSVNVLVGMSTPIRAPNRPLLGLWQTPGSSLGSGKHVQELVLLLLRHETAPLAH